MIMKYKNYIGRIEYDPEARIFHGDVIGLNDVITFQGRSIDELEVALKNSIEEYLDMCKEDGRKPEKSFNGNVRLRLDPTLHAEISHKASMQGMSLNTYITEKLKQN